MNKQSIYLLLAVFIFSLAACTAPSEKDIPGLTAEIDTALAGHYGQSIYHEELAEEQLEIADNVLHHWQDDHYWNIDERQKAMDAAQKAGQHRLQSERHLCEWLSSVHGHHHHGAEKKHIAAYFRTGSSVPYKTNDERIALMGKFLRDHPDAKADVIAYTDTVGSSASNQILSEQRAEHVRQELIAQGAKQGQLTVKAMGEAGGPNNTPNQKNRVVKISSIHQNQIDCSLIK